MLRQHVQQHRRIGGRLQPLHPQHDLDLDAGALIEGLADVPRPVCGLGPRRPVEGDVGADPGRAPFARQSVARLPRQVAEQDVALEALFERLPFEEGVLLRRVRNKPLPAGARLTNSDRLAGRYINDANWPIVERLQEFCVERGHTLLELAFSWLAAILPRSRFSTG